MRFGHHRPLWIDGTILDAWFPGMRHQPWLMNENHIVESLYDHLSNRYGVKKSEIELTLHKLFEQMEYDGNPYDYPYGETRHIVAQALVLQLNLDFNSFNGFPGKGLRRSRHAFVILAYLASYCESSLLAEVLINFWILCQQGIKQSEYPGYLQDWFRALQKIQEMAAGPAHMDHGWPRGRAARHLAIPFPGHRARSAPPRRRRSPEMRLIMPAYPGSAWTSPTMSPAMIQPNGFFDEVGMLQYQQEEMNSKLDNVDGKLNFLIQGMYSGV
jgi:hypothetical protein